MFAELDTAQRLASEKFLEHLRMSNISQKNKLAKQPDFIAIENSETTLLK